MTRRTRKTKRGTYGSGSCFANPVEKGGGGTCRRQETTTDFVTIHGQTADGDARPAIEQAKRVVQAVRTDRRLAILWSHQALNHEAVTWEILIVLGVDQLGAQRVVRQGGAPPCRGARVR